MEPVTLKKLFNFLPFADFSEPIEWDDGTGLSVSQEYKNNEWISLYKIGFNTKNLQGDTPLKKLWVTVSYGEKTTGGVKLGTAKSLFDPIDLSFYDEYSYNTETHKFYFNNKEISAKDLLLGVERAHKITTKKIKGFPLRFRLWFWRKAIPGVIKFFDKVLIDLLRLISGEKIKNDIWQRGFLERSTQSIPEKDIEFETARTMDFFGYKAKRWSVVFYCTLHLLAYLIFFYWNIKYSFLSNIFKNNFLSLCYVVVSFSFTESVVPRLLKSIIKFTPKLFSNILFKRLKINVA